MVKCNKFPVAPPSLAVEKQKGLNGSYSGGDVIEQLREDFHDKCYICELKNLQDPEIEHLIPKGKNIDLTFDWNNLFWSCGHCNSVKNNKKYNGKIINCCLEDPEKHISCSYADNEVNIRALDNEESSKMTAELVYNVFNYKNTDMRVYKSDFRIKALQNEMNNFFDEFGKYKEKQSNLNRKRIIARLRRSSAFAAFKRGYIRGNKAYAEFQQYVALD